MSIQYIVIVIDKLNGGGVKRVLGFLLTLIVFIPSISFASYVVSETIGKNVGNQTYTDGEKYKITFEAVDGISKQDTIIYVDSNYNLSLKDAPFVSSGNKNYDWFCGDISLSKFDKDTITDNYTFNAKEIESVQTLSDVIEDDHLTTYTDDKIQDPHSIDIDFISTDCDLTTKVQFYNGNSGDDYYSLDTHFYPSITGGTYTQVGGVALNGSYKEIPDYDVGLTISNTSEISDYKPVTGSNEISSATNFLAIKLTLQNDLILNGCDWTIAGHNGYYGNSNFSQIQVNNFIVGAYCELDLNGHDLILTNGANLNVYGSLTDSSTSRTGKVVVESSSSLTGLVTLEDVSHETDIAVVMLNQPLFRILRMPYLDCTIEIQNGGYLKGYALKDSGSASSTGYEMTYNIIGPQTSSTGVDTPLLQMSGGTITREVYYDSELKQKVSKNSETGSPYQNIRYQRIKYTISDSQVDFSSWELDIDYGGISFTGNFKESQFFVPFYFDFYLYNSTVNIDQPLVFMPGSYVRVDEKSTINLVYKSDPARCGGLIFSPYLFNEREASENSSLGVMLLKAGSSSTNDSRLPFVFSRESNLLWDYYNEKGAVCDFYGTITIDDSQSDDFGSLKYVLSGNINFYDLSQVEEIFTENPDIITASQPYFVPTLAHTNPLAIMLYVQYSEYFDWNTLDTYLNQTGGGANYIVLCYLISPLISNGYVVATDNEILTKTATYDAKSGLIKYTNGFNQTYQAYILDSYEMIKLAYDSTDESSFLRGEYKDVFLSADKLSITTSNKSTYINYQGLYVPATVSSNGSTATNTNLDRFIGGVSGRGYASPSSSSCELEYDSSLEIWTINSVA